MLVKGILLKVLFGKNKAFIYLVNFLTMYISILKDLIKNKQQKYKYTKLETTKIVLIFLTACFL